MSKDTFQSNPNSSDQDTQKILDDMGINEDGSPKEEPKEEPAKEPEVEPTEKSKVEEPPTEPEPSKPTPEPLPTEYIPIPKYKSEKQAWKTKEEELSNALKAEREKIADLERQVQLSKTPKDFQNRMNKIAEKYGTDPEAMSELGIEILNEAMSSTKPLTEKLKAYEEQTESIKQDKAFEDEFNGYLPSYPEMKDHKEAVKKLALSPESVEQWKGKSVFEVYFRGVKPTLKPSPKGAEPSKGGTGRGKKVIDTSKALSEEEISSMSSKDFEEYSNTMAKKQGLGLTKSFK